MAGGDHHTADRLVSLHRPRHRWSGRGGIRQRYGKTVTRKHLRHPAGKPIGEEPAVITHDGAFLGTLDRMLLPVVGGGLGDPVQIGEGEILCDDSAPAVGSEFNFGGHYLVSPKLNHPADQHAMTGTNSLWEKPLAGSPARIYQSGRFSCQGSSAVEQGTHKPLVGSSILPSGTTLLLQRLTPEDPESNTAG